MLSLWEVHSPLHPHNCPLRQRGIRQEEFIVDVLGAQLHETAFPAPSLKKGF